MYNNPAYKYAQRKRPVRRSPAAMNQNKRFSGRNAADLSADDLARDLDESHISDYTDDRDTSDGQLISS